MMLARLVLALALAAAAGAAAQQLYRWVDQQGRTHVTDTPPPPGAKEVRQLNPGAGSPAAAPGPQVPFVLQNAMKNNPVTLWSSPDCGELCASARELLNKRGVPFKEVQVLDAQAIEDLKRLSGKIQVPSLQVGASVASGYQPAAYEGMLDSAGYPRAGVLPARTQAAPELPETPKPAAPQPAPPKPEAAAKPEATEPAGPYAPGSPRQGSRQQKK